MNKIKHLCTDNDVNGNPRRLYVLTDWETGEPISAWDEGYLGHHAVPGPWRESAYTADRTKISVTKYNKLKRSLPSPDYAYDVPGYSHLRESV